MTKCRHEKDRICELTKQDCIGNCYDFEKEIEPKDCSINVLTVKNVEKSLRLPFKLKWHSMKENLLPHHSVLLFKTDGTINEGQYCPDRYNPDTNRYEGGYFIQYRWKVKINPKNVLYWAEIREEK